MKKAIIILVLVAASAGLVWISFLNTKGREQNIEEEIAKANYCSVASDCKMVAESQCPFGCYVHVNKNEAARISELIENYKNNENDRGYSCMYSCIEFKGVECINNTCQLMKNTNVSDNQGISANPSYVTFKDNEFPFTFSYPADWNMIELSTEGRTPNRAANDTLKDILIGKNVSTSQDNRKVGEWFIIRKGETPFPSNARPPSTRIALDGRQFDMYDIGSGLHIYIVQINIENDVYEITFNDDGVAPSLIFENLKSSFKFNE